jgi:hypothetical protein
MTFSVLNEVNCMLHCYISAHSHFEGYGKIIRTCLSTKLMGLASNWAARDNEIHVDPMQQRNSTVTTIYAQWKRKNNIE